MNLNFPASSIALFKLTFFCLIWSTLGSQNVFPNEQLQAYVLTLYLSQLFLQHSRVHVYTPSWSETREYLSKLIRVLLPKNFMQVLLQSRLNFSYAQCRYFLFIKKSSGQFDCLFQPVTCKRTEVKRTDWKRAENWNEATKFSTNHNRVFE